MHILAIDTSTRTGSVAILRDREILGQVSTCEEVPYSERLFRDLELLQSRAGFGLEQVDVFAVGAGPGSFTGLRVGLSAVKAWAEVYRKPIAAISGLEAIAAQARAGQTVLAPFLDARRGQIFGGVYRRKPGGGMKLELVGQEAVLSAEEFLLMAKETLGDASFTLVTPTPEVLSSNLAEAIFPGVRIEHVSPVLAPVIGQLGLECALSGNLVDPVSLEANYVRRSDAELFWKGA